jgi:hypothetical protein
MPSPQRYYGEGSASRRRRLDDSMPSLRQLVESKGTVDFSRIKASESPHMRFLKIKEMQQNFPYFFENYPLFFINL